MRSPQQISKVLQRILPSPLAIALVLTVVSLILALLFTDAPKDNVHLIQLLEFWHAGIFSTSLIEFAFQMMLILVLGHILVLSQPVQKLLDLLLGYVKSQSSAILVISVFTMLAGFLNWGLGLIFGAILARKIGEHAYRQNFKLNYPLICALGYGGMLIWHGGVSGSAPLKVAENEHLTALVPDLAAVLPGSISTLETTFSWQNLSLFVTVLIVIPLVMLQIARRDQSKLFDYSGTLSANLSLQNTTYSSHYLDRSVWFAKAFGLLVLVAVLVNYTEALAQFQLTPNLLNFSMLGLGLLLHKNLSAYLAALQQAISGAAGILIQFPLYFGILGILRDSGLIAELSLGISQFASAQALPVLSFFSAALVNLFVPSGGGQWAIQGPVIVSSAQDLGVNLPHLIMSFAYGDQLTNMLQPFWALPLLAITKVKAQHLLSYTLVMMLVAGLVFMGGILFLY